MSNSGELPREIDQQIQFFITKFEQHIQKNKVINYPMPGKI